MWIKNAVREASADLFDAHQMLKKARGMYVQDKRRKQVQQNPPAPPKYIGVNGPNLNLTIKKTKRAKKLKSDLMKTL